MLWSQTLIRTLRDTPAGVTVASHQLLVRSGLLREQSPGVIEFLPLGLRVLSKLETMARDTLAAVGATEIRMPQQVSEMDAAEFVAAAVQSFEVLPNRRYLFRNRLRGDPKPSFFRPRESLYCESYFIRRHKEAPGTDQGLRGAIEQVFSRLGIPVVLADADTGWQIPAIAFVVPCDQGDDRLLRSDRGQYTATAARAETGSRRWTFGDDPTGELEKVHTPNLKSVAEVAAFFSAPRSAILKTLVLRTSAQGPALSSGVDPKWVVAVVRGDDRVNWTKLATVVREIFHVSPLPLSDEGQDAGLSSDWPIGFVGPDAAMRKADAVLLVDYDAAQGASWIAGAGERDYHVRHFNWFRECGDRLADPRKTSVADIRYARAGDPAPGGGVLVPANGFEVGHAVGCGTRYRHAFGSGILGTSGINLPEAFGSCEIDLFRLLVATVECFHDDHGILWPTSIAPFSAVITALGYKGETRTAADRIYDQLNAANIDTILDDRDASPGVKFADADLIGFPVRVTVGSRGLKEGVVEVKARKSGQATKVPLDGVIDAVKRAIG